MRKKISFAKLGPAALLLVLVTLVLVVPLPLAHATPEERHVTITARSFAFEPGIINVNRGDTVVIRLESADVVHGLYVDGYGIKSAEVEPGRSTEVRFTADKSGAYRLRCSVSCGNMHPFMIGKLVVGPNLTWIRAVAATVITALGVVVWVARPGFVSPLP